MVHRMDIEISSRAEPRYYRCKELLVLQNVNSEFDKKKPYVPMSYFLVAQKEMHVYYFVNQLPKLTYLTLEDR